MAGRPLRGYAVTMNLKIASLAAALALTAAAVGAQSFPNEASPFETMGAYDVPGQWLSKDCMHAPCALAPEPGKTAKAAPETPAAQPKTFTDNTPVNTRPGEADGRDVTAAMQALNSPGDAGQSAQRAAPNAPVAYSAAGNPETIVHIENNQDPMCTFKHTCRVLELINEEKTKLNEDPRFARPGETPDVNNGTSGFNLDPRPTRVRAQ